MNRDLEDSVEYLLGENPNQRKFNSIHEHVAFLQQYSSRLRSALVQTQQHLEEYQLESKEYEEELEHSLEVSEKQNKELRHLVHTMQLEIDQWKTKFNEAEFQHNRTIDSLQRESLQLKASSQDWKEKARALELENDELERAQRVMESSRLDAEQKAASLMERNTFLEHEVVMKQRLVMVVQRLKDQIRDQQNEITVLKQPPPPSSTAVPPKSYTSSPPMSRVKSALKDTLVIEKQAKKETIEAAKTVEAMLDRVKALESRLKKCRESTAPPPSTPPTSHSQSMPQSLQIRSPPPCYEAAMKDSPRPPSSQSSIHRRTIEDQIERKLASRRAAAAATAAGNNQLRIHYSNVS